jgi:hypothetical protein
MPMTAIEHPADGTWSPQIGNGSYDVYLELCNGTLIVESYGTANRGEHRIRITNRLLGDQVTLSWEQWEDFKEALDRPAAAAVQPAADGEQS